MDDFTGNFKLPVLSAEIENQNQDYQDRNENIVQEMFLLSRPQSNRLCGEVTLNFRGMKDFSLF